MPNAAEWELKTQRKNTSALLTLFHLEPSPTALSLVNYLLINFGWEHKDAGGKYPLDEKSFRQTILYKTPTSRGFYFDIDNINKRIVVKFNYNAINYEEDQDIAKWKNNLKSHRIGEEHTPYWGFHDLASKAGLKLKNCFFVEAETKNIGNTYYYKYTNITLLSNFSFEKFIHNMQNKSIYIDFDARTRHNHGTKFRCRANVIKQLYDNVREI